MFAATALKVLIATPGDTAPNAPRDAAHPLGTDAETGELLGDRGLDKRAEP